MHQENLHKASKEEWETGKSEAETNFRTAKYIVPNDDEQTDGESHNLDIYDKEGYEVPLTKRGKRLLKMIFP